MRWHQPEGEQKGRGEGAFYFTLSSLVTDWVLFSGSDLKDFPLNLRMGWFWPSELMAEVGRKALQLQRNSCVYTNTQQPKHAGNKFFNPFVSYICLIRKAEDWAGLYLNGKPRTRKGTFLLKEWIMEQS